jgi:hypothetical protein
MIFYGRNNGFTKHSDIDERRLVLFLVPFIRKEHCIWSNYLAGWLVRRAWRTWDITSVALLHQSEQMELVILLGICSGLIWSFDARRLMMLCTGLTWTRMALRWMD